MSERYLFRQITLIFGLLACLNGCSGFQAAMGNSDAQFEMGEQLWFADRPAEAAVWFLRAAEQGHVQSQVRLGNLYYLGELPGGPEEAVKWYRRASEKDDVGQYMLGECYRRGRGVPQNFNEAMRWFLLGEEGTAIQQRRLEACFAFYQAAPDKYDEAYAIETAEADTQEVYGRYDMWRDLSPDQLAEGLKRLTEYEEAQDVENGKGSSGK
jgi:TPR repeat protein